MTEDKDVDIELKDEDRTPCEIWTRCMGYHRPVSYFNIGKLGEYKERKYFTEEKARANYEKPGKVEAD